MINSRNEYKVIANFESDTKPLVGEALRHKWYKRHSQSDICKIIPLREILNDTVTLSKLKMPYDGKIQIDVLVHTVPGIENCLFVYKDTDNKIQKQIIRYDKLAEILSRLIGDHHNVEINLIACGSAKGDKNKLSNSEDDPRESFAVKLQNHLSELQHQDIKVRARTQITAIDENKNSPDYGKKFTADKRYTYDQVQHIRRSGKEKIENINKQAGTKVEITQGLIIDSYSKSWKEKVLSELDTLLKATNLPEKQALFRQWLIDFPNQEPNEIYNTLRTEINKPNTILGANSSQILNLFSYSSGSRKKVETLVGDGEKFISSAYPTKKT